MTLNLMTISAHLLEHGVGLFISISASFVLFLPFASTFGYLAVIGIAALVLRRVFLWAVPFLARNAEAVTAIINIVFEVLEVVVMGIRTVVLYLLNILDMASRFVLGFPAIKAPGHMGDGKVELKDLDATQVKRTLNEIQDECPAYNSISAISQHITRQTLNQYTCPIVRATVPLGPVGVFTKALFSPFSYDATPFPGKPGHVKEINCEGPEDQDVTWACVVLGAGYLVLEFLIPLLILGIFLYTTGGAIFRLIGDVVSATFWIATLGFHVLMFVLSEI